jgi:hypothetical protein
MPVTNFTVTLDGGAEVPCQLYYRHDLGLDAGPFDYLHRIRTRAVSKSTGGAAVEESYWQSLHQRRTDFANGLPDPGAFDLIVDPLRWTPFIGQKKALP